VEVTLADTTGELRRLTALASVVFVGKSLSPHREGQTPIEAAAAGKAIVMGDGMSNFREASRELVAAGAARTVVDRAELERAIESWLRDAGLRCKQMASCQPRCPPTHRVGAPGRLGMTGGLAD
jgi:3-deoxy-D-manno-octulosonic-acid transferase